MDSHTYTIRSSGYRAGSRNSSCLYKLSYNPYHIPTHSYRSYCSMGRLKCIQNHKNTSMKKLIIMLVIAASVISCGKVVTKPSGKPMEPFPSVTPYKQHTIAVQNQ